MGITTFEPCFLCFLGTNSHRLYGICVTSILCSASISASTGQAQDFKDIVGDRLVGRKNLPIVAPNISRPTLMLRFLAWSVYLSAIWRLSTVVALAFILLALLVGIRFIVFDTIKADQRGYYCICTKSVLRFILLCFQLKLTKCCRSGFLSLTHFLHIIDL